MSFKTLFLTRQSKMAELDQVDVKPTTDIIRLEASTDISPIQVNTILTTLGFTPEKAREINPYAQYKKQETPAIKIYIYTQEDYVIIEELLDLALCIFYIKLINVKNSEIKTFLI